MNKKILFIIGIVVCASIFFIALNMEDNNFVPLIGGSTLIGIIYFASKIDKLNKEKIIMTSNSFDYSTWGFSKAEFDDMKQQIIQNWSKDNKIKCETPCDNDVYWGLIQRSKIFSQSYKEYEYFQKLEEEFLKWENANSKNTNTSGDKFQNDSELDLSNFSKEYLNTKLEDGLTIKEHMKQGYKKEIEYEKNSPNPKFHRTFEEQELSFEFFQNRPEKVRQLENIIYNNIELKISNLSEIGESVSKCNESIKAYYELKKFCYKTKGGKIYFQDRWEYCHNSNNLCFEYVTQLEDNKKYLLDLYKKEYKNKDININNEKLQ